MSEPTPVTEDGEVIGVPPNPPPADQSVDFNPEPIVMETFPPTPAAIVVDEDE